MNRFTVKEGIIRVNPYSRPGIELKSVFGVVWHYFGNPGQSAEELRRYWLMLAEQDDPAMLRKLGYSEPRYAGSHYGIDSDGVVLYVPETEVAFHAGASWWNKHTLGLECAHPDESGRFDPKTEEYLIYLTANICRRYDIDPMERNRVSRHHDITGKNCPKYLVDHPDIFQNMKKEVARVI